MLNVWSAERRVPEEKKKGAAGRGSFFAARGKPMRNTN